MDSDTTSTNYLIIRWYDTACKIIVRFQDTENRKKKTTNADKTDLNEGRLNRIYCAVIVFFKFKRQYLIYPILIHILYRC